MPAASSPGSTSHRRCSNARAASCPRPCWVEGDLLALPFDAGSFEAATVGFGVRNVADLEAGIARAPPRARGRRACRRARDHAAAGGALAPFYRLWFDRIVPLLGRLLKGGDAYSYLPASVRRFPGPDQLAEMMRTSGFDDVSYSTFAGGIVALHVGSRR